MWAFLCLQIIVHIYKAKQISVIKIVVQLQQEDLDLRQLSQTKEGTWDIVALLVRNRDTNSAGPV